MRLLFLLPIAALGMAGCLSESSDPIPTDPYAGMSCERKIAAIAGEIQAYQASQPSTAKVSTPRSDTVQPDTVKPDTARNPIPIFRGWPPVAGLDSVPDTVTDGTSPGVRWIQPVGFDTAAATPGILPVTPNPLPETTPLSALPASVSALQIVSTGAYRARVRIHDFRNELVREFDQDFGYRGELDNPGRRVTAGFVSFLVWDGKDRAGLEVPTGVYLWKVRLEMESQQVVERNSKTGYIGRECRQQP